MTVLGTTLTLTADEADMLRRQLTYWLETVDSCGDDWAIHMLDGFQDVTLKVGGPEHRRSRSLLKSALKKLL